jgi:hypothetical protein
MPLEVNITGLSGSSPFNIWICDNPETTCIYVDTVDSSPLTFDVPTPLSFQNDWTIKSIDNNNCISRTILTA